MNHVPRHHHLYRVVKLAFVARFLVALGIGSLLIVFGMAAGLTLAVYGTLGPAWELSLGTLFVLGAIIWWAAHDA